MKLSSGLTFVQKTLCAYENHNAYEMGGVGGHWSLPACALRRSPRPAANGVSMIRAQRVALLKAILTAVRTDLRAQEIHHLAVLIHDMLFTFLVLMSDSMPHSTPTC